MSKPISENAPQRLYLVDGSGYIFRAYHSLPPLTRGDGTPVGAVYGFTNMLLKLAEEYGQEGAHVAVIFDAARRTFRNDIYPEYKAHRPPAPEDLVPQFPLVREATRALNLPSIEMEGFEADDLIASYAKAARAEGMEVIIVSSDKDLMQLVRDGVSLYDPVKQKPIGEAEVLEKFGVAPEKVIEAQALIGDSTDNVPGVPGIGPKTAAELINQYGTLENLLAHTHEIKQPKRREALEQNAEQARLSYQLVTLKDDIALPMALDELHPKAPDVSVLVPFLQQQNFKSLVTRMQQKYGSAAAETTVAATATPAAPVAAATPAPALKETHYTLLTDMGELERWVKAATAQGYVAVDTETNSLDAMTAELVGISLALKPGKACYIPLAHVAEQEEAGHAPQADLFSAAPVAKTLTKKRVAGQLEKDKVLAVLKPLLEDAAVLKIGQNIKYDMLVLQQQAGIRIAPVEDTMLLSYVLDAGAAQHNMDDMAQRLLGIKTISFTEVTGTGRNKITFDEVALEQARDYAAEDADVTLRLQQVLKPRVVEEQMLSVYETIERPLIPVLVAMESRGVKIDLAQLEALSADFAARLSVLEADVYKLAGHEFNIGSPKQLGEVLFDEMALEGGKKSAKTGAYSTGADVLEELAAQGHALPAKVLEWRQLSKLKSTYSDALAQQINAKTGRVHTSFSMAATNTGRLSSTDPNLQNIPVRTEDGRKIRHAFVAEQGNKLISADYSQIELRLLAHVADIAVLKDAFLHGRDIHAATASQMFGVPMDKVDSDLRRSAKTINFGIIYGISAHGLAANLGISRGEAAAYIDQYFKQYPGIRAYMEQAKEFARKHGFVTTLFGRKCHLPDINNKNPNMRAFQERVAINAPLQGTAADIIKRAMVAVENRLAREFPQAQMLLQVHDELLLEVPVQDADAVAAIVKQEMENAAHLSVPLTVEASVGDNWGSIH